MIGWTRKDKYGMERSCGRNQWFSDYPHLFPFRDDAPCYESEGFPPKPLDGKYKNALEELCPKFTSNHDEYCCNGFLVQNLGRAMKICHLVRLLNSFSALLFRKCQIVQTSISDEG